MGTPRDLRPAWYALRRGGARDYVTLLHPPYTLWHLSYVAVGAAVAPHFRLERLLLTLLAFFLAMGIAAHALDELHGRPLATRIPGPALVALAAGGLAGAVAVGVYAALAWGLGLLVFVAVGAVLVPAYNLELAFHNDVGFALAWGAFPALTAYFAQVQTIGVPGVAAAVYALAASLAQRALSTPVRRARREYGTLEGTAPLESALRLLTWATVALAVAAVAARLR
ncbi:MAG TPA: hypothetical protein VFA05_01345 [Gaiellaceae bacterium]|nr:hypothetical protein [Gaiellaceae bacterium]